MATKPPTSALPNSSSLVFQSISDLSQLLMIFCAKAPVVFFSNQLIGKTPHFQGIRSHRAGQTPTSCCAVADSVSALMASKWYLGMYMYIIYRYTSSIYIYIFIYVYMYLYIYIYICIHLYIYIMYILYICIYVFIYMYIYIYICICIYICIYVYLYMYIYICVYVCICIGYYIICWYVMVHWCIVPTKYWCSITKVVYFCMYVYSVYVYMYTLNPNDVCFGGLDLCSGWLSNQNRL